MAQTTAQKLVTTYWRKIDNGNPNNSANTDIYAYPETTFCVPTGGYGMTENWTYAFCRIWEDVSDSHLGHTLYGHKKTVLRIRFTNHIKTLLECKKFQ